MNTNISEIISLANSGLKTYCKFLSANDTGETGGHQAGIYVAKPAISILFDTPGVKGSNKDKWVKIIWQNDFVTDTRFIYYGTGSRNEYRITNFGKNFPFLNPSYTGALFILIQIDQENYNAFVLNDEESIDDFLNAYGITPAETNRLLQNELIDLGTKEKINIDLFVKEHTSDFPSSEEMSYAARMIYYNTYLENSRLHDNPDKLLLEWTDEEYKLFRAMEHAQYGDSIIKGFSSVEDFVTLANKVLNRRKSRAGKSLEHHLAALFDEHDIRYSAQAVTEGNKRPDFIFPSQEAYANPAFPVSKLTSLAAKTTCKDRWRQILNEANRLRDQNKYLCTLQQGISTAQMDEMQEERVILVVPQAYIRTYPVSCQNRIWTIKKFLTYVKELDR